MKFFCLVLLFTVQAFLLFLNPILANTIPNCDTLNSKNNISIDSAITQKEVLTYDGIDSVLNTFKITTFEELDQEYLNFSGYDQWPRKTKMQHRNFYSIVGSDSLKYLVGKFKVEDFLPKDSLCYQNIGPQNENYIRYLCIDTCVLHRFLDLILLLRENGYLDAFTINDGYRYPSFNKRTGGVLYSQHMFGNAIDLAIGDINGDGVFEENKDKWIVIKYLENYIIKDTGGVGRYPGSNVVHFDTRGIRARWDEQ